jgi:hypothetical protein
MHGPTCVFWAKLTPFSLQWLRAVGKGEFTSAHIDSVYMGRGSKQLTTCWIPFGDVSVSQGIHLIATLEKQPLNIIGNMV